MKVWIANRKTELDVPAMTNLLSALRDAGFGPDAPCGGKGTCGKCKVLVDGQEQLACKTLVDRDMVVYLPEPEGANVLTEGLGLEVNPDGTDRYVMAVDVGTTTVVTYLLDGHTGQVLAKASCVNPQTRYGADVISRIQYAMDTDAEALRSCIGGVLQALMGEVAQKAGIDPKEITAACLVGNTAMHHLLLGFDPKPLTTPPYMPAVSKALEWEVQGVTVRVLPNIAGFVGADTVACLVASRFDQLEEMTLLIDIGTNGEMVLGNREGFLACSTAAGPAFEGALISCGMRGSVGAIDHVKLENGEITYTVIGGGEAVGLCGSGLLDLVAALLEREDIDESGRMEDNVFTVPGTNVHLTQKDVRQVQLAKAAIRAGIELMCKKLGIRPEQIQRVYLAGAFGNYLDPVSACVIGMIPPCLQERIQSIGNAAGAGAKACALSREEFAYSIRLAQKAQFLELASMEEFNDCYVDCLLFEEEE